MASRPGRSWVPEIMAARVSRTCWLAFSTTGRGSGLARAPAMYALSWRVGVLISSNGWITGNPPDNAQRDTARKYRWAHARRRFAWTEDVAFAGCVTFARPQH